MNKPDVHPAINDCYLDHPYALAGRVIDPVSGNVSWLGKLVHLQRKDLEVLALLASVTGSVVSRASFIAVVWDGNDLVGDRGVSDKIFSLRRALADHDESQPIIRTIPRRGYQLSVAAVQPIVLEQPAFAPGKAIAGCAGWHLQRQLSTSEATESWLAHSDDQNTAPRVFSFCRSEAHLRRLQRETTLLRYLSESLGERQDFALIRDWQLQEPPYFLARDYCTHASLTAWATAVGGLSAQSLAQRSVLMLALTAAVASVHEIGVVHGQLSSASILLDDVANLADQNAAPQLKLSAFDLGALRDHSKLAALKITAAGLSFVEGTFAPTMADDIYALGALLLQLAVGDLNAEPGAASLQRILNPDWRNFIAACFGPDDQRPSAAQLLQQLSGNVVATKSAAAESTDAAKPSPVPVRATLLGQSVGPYRLTDKLGEGGMGTVYLAEQRDPVQRQVAVKLIKLGMDTAEVLARFEAERQALALMNHVNIAGVYDAGAAQSGRPYFAMEYVPGLEITAHCDERELDFRQRIELFLQVCDGVLHAHQKGIIHRDLKPSNILIKTAQGQAATAKIIDFGVAKSLQRKLGSLTAHTQLGSFVGTRTYSSPEQISGNIVALDTRTDTYSLGVVLYELLAGVTPYDEEVLAAKSPIALSKLISQEEPPPLLKRFVSLDAQVESDIATRRKLSVAQMKQTLSSDLAWIVAKCLERDPNARYASVLELKKDLGRWLENRPVEARPITWRYRTRKMVRRNWVAVALGSVVTLALMITSTAAVLSYVRAETSLAEAELVAEFQNKQIRAINPAAMGLKLREILLEALKQADSSETVPNASLTSRLTSLNMTDVALKQLDALYFEPALAAMESDFEQSPLVKARLQQSLVDALTKMGQFERAAKVLESALELRTKLLGSQHQLTLELLKKRAEINGGLGQYVQAEADLRTVLAATRAQFGARHQLTVRTQRDLGFFLIISGNDREAVVVLEEALRGCREVFGDSDARTLTSMSLLAEATFRQGNLDEAEKLAQAAVEGFRQLSNKSSLEKLSALGILASVVAARGRLDLAETLRRELVQDSEQLYGTDSMNTLSARANLANVLGKADRFQESIILHREVLSSRRQILGLDHPHTLQSEMFLGRTLQQSGQLAEAEGLLRATLKKLTSGAASSGPLTFDVMFHLGLTAKDQGKLDEAERLLNESLDGRRRVSGDAHRDTQASIKALEELKEYRRSSADQ